MFYKKKNRDLTQLIILLSIMIYFYGARYTFNLIFNIFKMMNTILTQTLNSSLLSYTFKYGITFAIVGFILFKINSPRGKVGHILGKVLYAIVGLIVSCILNGISRLIF